jgi:hypothetical protein
MIAAAIMAEIKAGLLTTSNVLVAIVKPKFI